MKRPHRSAHEWQTLISQWQASGVSAPAFCEQHRIGYASFCQWQQRLRSADGVEESAISANTFIDLGALSAGNAALGQGWHIVLSLKNQSEESKGQTRLIDRLHRRTVGKLVVPVGGQL